MSEPNDGPPITDGVPQPVSGGTVPHQHTISDVREAFTPLPPGSSIVVEAAKPLPTVGRILHAHSNLWHGPRAAIVVNDLGRADLTNVHVLLDPNDTEALEEVRRSPSGSTLASVRVFAALSEQERAQALADAAKEHRLFGGREIAIICEWPTR